MLLLWQSVLFYAAIGLLEVLGVDRLLDAFQSELRAVLSGWYFTER